MRKFMLAAATGAAILAAAPALAQHHGSHGATPAATASPSPKAFEAANDRMHRDMAIKFSGDADIDFIKGMIPHHQGAIDMAKVVLQHGKDAETKKLATEIIAAQEKEIAMMQEWLKKRGQ
ncbi:MAG: CopM family metallochaperone [Albidovulum sp.]